nr:MAG TPA: hypothetical protein [Caudoviricetes sp.]
MQNKSRLTSRKGQTGKRRPGNHPLLTHPPENGGNKNA